MILEAGIWELRVGVPKELEVGFGSEIRDSGWLARASAPAVNRVFWANPFQKANDLRQKLKPVGTFAHKHNLKVTVTGPGLAVYPHLQELVREIFGEKSELIGDFNALLSGIHGCIETRQGLGRVIPNNFMQNPAAPLVHIPSPDVAYPYLLVDLRTNSTFTLVN